MCFNFTGAFVKPIALRMVKTLLGTIGLKKKLSLKFMM